MINKGQPAGEVRGRLVQREQAPRDGPTLPTLAAVPPPAPDGRQTERNRGDSMTQWDRPSSSSGAPAERPSAPAAPPCPPSLPSAAGPLWDEWFTRASPDQRQHALSRAASEGLLYAHQLPAPEGGAGPA